MFEFEITLDKSWHDKETVISGKAIGCIDDYIVRTIKSDDGSLDWLKIGDVIVPRYKVEAIKVKAVSE